MATDTDSVELVDADVVANLARAAVLAALTGAFAVAGAVPIPLSPVPLSLQPLAVFLAGLLLGARWGAAAMGLYLAAGALGAPVFAGGQAGVGVLVGDSGGYLWGYVLAAGVIGLVTHGGLDAGDLSAVSVPRQVLALAGLLLGARWGAAAMGLYLAAGALGAPVFAGGQAGVGVLVGDSGGYLWGYVLAAGVIGLVTHGGLDAGDLSAVSVPRQVLALAAGTLVIYAAGVVGLLAVLDLSPRAAVVSGALVFLPGEALKMAAAVAIVRSEELARVAGAG